VNIRLICTDLDGTFFAPKSVVPDINRAAVRECEKRGIHIAFISGRGYPMVKRLSAELGINAAIASANGSRIDSDSFGNTIFEGYFEVNKCRELMRLFMEEGVNFEAYTKWANYVSRPELMPSRHRQGLQANIKAGDIELIHDEERMLREAAGASYKLVVFSEDPSVIQRIRRVLDERSIAHCSSGSQNVEVMPEGIGKGEALLKLADHFGVPVEETMAFGDYTNDLSMLRAAGHPVAMENGVEELKRMAEFIAPHHAEGGFGQAVYQYVLKERYNP